MTTQTLRDCLKQLSASGRCFLETGQAALADPGEFLRYADQPGPIFDQAQQILAYPAWLDYQVTETTESGSVVGALTVWLGEDQETDGRIYVPMWKARIRYCAPKVAC